MSKNYAHLEGNLGQKPELRSTPSGASVCSVSLCTNYKKGDKDYQTWHRISTWGETAEKLSKFNKGDKISAEGFIRYNEWEDKNGVKHKDAEIQCYDVDLLFRKGQRSPSNTDASSGGNDDIPY